MTRDEWTHACTGRRAPRLCGGNRARLPRAGADVAVSKLALEAEKRTLERRRITPREVDMVIVASSSPGYAPIPATARVAEERLGCESAETSISEPDWIVPHQANARIVEALPPSDWE